MGGDDGWEYCGGSAGGRGEKKVGVCGGESEVWGDAEDGWVDVLRYVRVVGGDDEANGCGIDSGTGDLWKCFRCKVSTAVMNTITVVAWGHCTRFLFFRNFGDHHLTEFY